MTDDAHLGPEHTPVLLQEVLEHLAPAPKERFLDGTLGLGGHSLALLEAAGEGAELLGLDRDAEALEAARKRLAGHGLRVHLEHLPYSRFEEAMDHLGWDKVDKALLDIGVSSMQLNNPERGFSFLRPGPLDMRMDPDSDAPSARDLVNRLPWRELARIIGQLGEEPMAGRIARAIEESRNSQGPIETTGRLAAIVERAYPAKWRRTARNHPATRTFQGLRMAVNQELEELESFLEKIVPRLQKGGRVAVISFHSLEDRIVKRFFRDQARKCRCAHDVHPCSCGGPRLEVLTRKPVVPTGGEARANPRARSAKLRAARRTTND